jgi:hypothetical protein
MHNSFLYNICIKLCDIEKIASILTISIKSAPSVELSKLLLLSLCHLPDAYLIYSAMNGPISKQKTDVIRKRNVVLSSILTTNFEFFCLN